MALLSYYPANARDRETGHGVHALGPVRATMPGFGPLPVGPGVQHAAAIYPDGKLRLVDPDRLEPIEVLA